VGILRQFSACFTDYRNPDLIEHTVEELWVWCSWRFVIWLSTGHVTMFRWLYVGHFKGTCWPAGFGFLATAIMASDIFGSSANNPNTRLSSRHSYKNRAK
jgi:hypothetical protein